MNLTELEWSVLSWFADRGGIAALRSQCETASAISRDHTGHGQITSLTCSSKAPSAEFPTVCVPNAPLISSSVLAHDAGADLWLKDGRIAELESITFGGTNFPTDPFPFQLVEAL